jgi:drug/metabolite transporter (DMT)-like permease
MTWIVLAALTAVSESAKDVLSKERLQRIEPLRAAWAWRCLALPFLLPLLLFTGLPALGPDFWWALAVSGVLNAVTAVLYMESLKASDLSLAVPMIALTPLFLLVTSPLLLGEFPGAMGVAGVLLVVAGSYRLGEDGRGKGLFAPFRALWRERGARLMLLVALVWSVSGNIDKIGVRNSSPLFWAAALHAAIAVLLWPLVLRSGRRAQDDERLASLLPVGAAGAFGALCQMTAISLTLVPYVIAIKRTSAVLSTLWGHLVLGEPGLSRRLPAVLLMVAGAVLVTLD